MTPVFSGIQISGLRNPGLCARISGVLSAALEPVQVKPLAAKVPFFDASFKSLERQLERYRERDRDSRRHPKKYYVAKRLLQGEGAPREPAGEE